MSLMPGIHMNVFMQAHQENYFKNFFNKINTLNYNIGKNLSTRLFILFCYLEAPASVCFQNNVKCPLLVNLTFGPTNFTSPLLSSQYPLRLARAQQHLPSFMEK